MSKTSAKQRYLQLVDWLGSYKPSPKYKKKQQAVKGSRINYYKSKGYKNG